MTPEQRAKALVGKCFEDRYQVDEVIAAGAMATVYLGRHLKLKKRVALKVLHPDVEDHPEMFLRFDREALAGSQVAHANVAGATDFGDLEDGTRYLVMEYVKGRTLRELIDAEAPLDPARAVRIARQLASALDHVHARGIVHRDLKPRNVIVTDEDVAKIVDFGLAKIDGHRVSTLPADEADEDQRLTARGVIFGTVEYLAPEAAFGMELVDGRADLYALGVILYEMLSGKHPFEAKTEAELFAKQRHAAPPRPSERAPGVAIDPKLEAVVMKLLSKDFDVRHQSGAEVVEALDAALEKKKRRKKKEKGKEKDSGDAGEHGRGAESGGRGPAEGARADGRSRWAPGLVFAGVMALAGWGIWRLGSATTAAPLASVPAHVAASGQVPPAASTSPAAPASASLPAPVSASARVEVPVFASAAPDPAVRSALVEALEDAVEKGAWDEAADTARELFAHDPKAPEEKRARAALADLLLGLAKDRHDKTDAIWRAVALAPGGPDLVYSFIERHGKAPWTDRARALLRDAAVMKNASPALVISFELREAQCDQKQALLERAVAEGDARTLVVLDILVRGCVKNTKPVDAAMKKLRERLAAETAKP